MAPEPAPLSAISFSDLTKVYRLYDSPRDRLIEFVLGRPRHSEVQALRGVSATVPRGAVVGVIGENGSGKSTLLKILAGTTAPTSGTSAIEGRVAAILELGSSFHPEVTGRRNAALQAALTGLSSAELEAALPEIEAFADLGEFFDRPVKTYSSGMSMRLAFAVATAVLPDIVILDEALAVGDARFQKKCVDRIYQLRAQGKTIFFCSHALYYVSVLCDRALWLRSGEIAGDGNAQKVVLQYEEYLARKDQDVKPAAQVPVETLGRFTSIRILDGSGKEASTFRPGDPWTIELSFRAETPDLPLHVHVGVVTPDQVTCFVADSKLAGRAPFSGRSLHTVRISVDSLPLAKGEFIAVAFLGDEKGLALFDARSDARFRVESDRWTSGFMVVPHTFTEVD
jgi:ABC-type polysaccharide/polyol phosphate transport system ATPase subunit